MQVELPEEVNNKPHDIEVELTKPRKKKSIYSTKDR